MNTPRLVALVGSVLFGVSFLLPAYGDSTGFACLRFCAGLLGEGGDGDLFVKVYYPAFVLTNAAFLGLAWVALRPAGVVRSWHLAAGVAAVLHILSWFVMNVVKGNGEKFLITIGYYVWLAGFAAVLWSLWRRWKTAAK